MKIKFLTFLFVLIFTVPQLIGAGETHLSRTSRKHAQKKTSQYSSGKLQQVASFSTRKNAENLVRQLRREGQQAVIKKGTGKNRRAVYRVFVMKKKGARKMGPEIAEKTPPASEKREVEKAIGGEPGDVRERPDEPVAAAPSEGRQVASLIYAESRAEADRLADQLRAEGYKVTIRSAGSRDGKTVYSVFAQSAAASAMGAEPTPEMRSAKTFSEEIPSGREVASSSDQTAAVPGSSAAEPEKTEEKLTGAKEAGETSAAGEIGQKTSGLYPRGVETPSAEGGPSEAEKAIAGMIAAKEAREAPEGGEMKAQSSGMRPQVEERLSSGKVPSEPERSVAGLPVSKEAGELSAAGEVKQQSSGMQPLGEGVPTGSSKGGGLSSDVFGRKGGFVHPFMGITEYFTDNVFNTKSDKVSDFTTVFSPGVWLSVPHINEKLLSIDTSNVSPGGYTLSRYNPETFKRYQTYLFYNADIELHARESAGNAVNHRAEGLFQYNLRGGLTFELLDQFLASHDMWGTGLSEKRLDRFRTNLADLSAQYDTEGKMKFRLDYTNNIVDYLAARNRFRDRADNSVSAYIFYKLRPKTSLFYEYEFVDVDYKDSVLSDSTEHHNFVGVQWDITGKSKGSVKAGYGLKYFSDDSADDARDFIVEAQVDHKLSGKTSLIFKASRRTEETNISTTSYVLTDSVSGEYLHRITGKITLDAMLSYTHDKYFGDITLDGTTKQLTDNYYVGMLALQYKFREWLEFDSGYLLNARNSNFSDLGYTSNIIFLRITGSL